MKKFTVILIIFLSTISSFAQLDKDTLKLKEVVVTATRFEKEVNKIPIKIEVVSAEDIGKMPVINTDDVFKAVGNINVNRSWGPYSKNASVTMRGLSSSARTLVMLDGMPLNAAAGGSINWHMIDPENISMIEVTKGPNSALYGNNAMGGVINIISKRPESPLTVQLNTYAGSYKTIGQHILVSGNQRKNDRGFYWGINGFARKGNGYYFNTEGSRNFEDTTTFIKEYNGGGYVGYQLNKNHKIEISGNYFDDVRNEGIKVYEEKGSYYKFTTKTFKANYWGKIQDINITAVAFRKQQDNFYQQERLNKSAEYKLMETTSKDIDEGIWIAGNKNINNKNLLTFGAEFKHSNTDYSDIYFTSYDEVHYFGAYNFYALFLQDEYDINKKIKLLGGLRFDNAHFYDGSFTVMNPSNATGYDANQYQEYKQETWSALSYKFAINYTFSDKIRNYLSVASGFTPPKLDDLCRSGKIRKGIKVANPGLLPEKIFNIETGTFITLKYLEIEPSIYYTRGKDFQYLVVLDDNYDMDGETTTLLQKQNISDVEIIGAEINIKFKILKGLNLISNYSYNHSTIKEDHSNNENSLSGKYLAEVSPHMFYAGLFYTLKKFSSYISYSYTDEQWIDDDNTQLVDSYSIVDFKSSFRINKTFNVYLDIQNLLDNEFIDRKGYPSPGRLILLGLKIKFEKIR